MKVKALLFIFCFVYLCFFCKAAKIYGDVYDIELNKVKALIIINTTPQQRIINYSYEFEVYPGVYCIKAYLVENNINYYAEEVIKVEEGNYRIDLILFPVDEEVIEDEKIKEIMSLLESIEKSKKKFSAWPIVSVLIFIFLVFIAIFIFKFIKKRKKLKKEIDLRSVDEFKNKVESILKKEKRILQKDLRKMLNVSEAKLSLLITELEEEGKVKKIKRGRGNIIIWQEA